MTIDGTNINTFGLHLVRPDGYLDHPDRKSTLSEPGFETKDIVFENKETTINLLGVYETKTDLFAAVQGLKDLIKTDLIHDFTIARHGLTFSGVVTDGIKIDVIKTLAKINFKIKITA